MTRPAYQDQLLEGARRLLRETGSPAIADRITDVCDGSGWITSPTTGVRYPCPCPSCCPDEEEGQSYEEWLVEAYVDDQRMGE